MTSAFSWQNSNSLCPASFRIPRPNLPVTPGVSFQFADSQNVNIHSCHLLFDHFQLALIHGPNVPGSYAILLFTALDFTSITSHIHNWVLFSLWLCLFILSGMWSYFSTYLQQHIGHLPTWGVHLSVSYLFAFSCCSWGSQGKNTEVICHSLLQWTTFCQTSPP